MKDTIIKTKGLTKTYQRGNEKIFAVDGVDLEITRGEFIAVMGPSGSGKTTLLDLIGCLDSISGGSLEVFGKDVSSVAETNLVSLRRGNIGFIFQEFLLIPSLTAVENVMLSLYFARSDKTRESCVDLLINLGLGHRIDHLPGELSGGERQRVAVARALVVSPKFLIADEPTGNLDSKSSQEILDVFKQLNREGLTIVLATHDQDLGSQAGRIVRMKDGKVVS